MFHVPCSMKIIVGLGNPGEKYEKNRHNVGFLIVDSINKIMPLPFSDFSFNKKFNADISERTLDDKKFIFAKPQTFMNASGESVQKILSYYKLTPEDLIVIHDDLDIEIGNYKIQKDVRSVGHNGVESIINQLGTQNFTRVRVGVEKQGGRKERNIPGEDFVLQNFTSEDLEMIRLTFPEIAAEIL